MVSFEQPKSFSTAISDCQKTALGEYAATVAAHTRGGSGFYPLDLGSLNLDPRSIELNAEMGLLIDAEPMVNEMTRDLAEGLATLTYRVRINDEGTLEWHSRIDNQPVVENQEPLTGGWRRFKAWLMKIAPERQL